eukprot:COSAG02_NODE_665_length_18739_cov_9.192918_13_plen_461_part_00
MAKKRAKAMTRDTMIALLRTRGVKGRLSKMTKPQLKKMVESTAPPSIPESTSMTSDRPKGDLELEPDDQSGGHYFQSFGKASASEMRKYKHTHEKDDMPTSNTQRGSGHSYRDFVAAQMRQNGGDMKAAVAKYREMKGGHMVRADGTISDKEDAKYRHRHKNLPNPAKKAGSKSPERTASPDDDAASIDDAFEPPESPPKPAPKPKAAKARTRATARADDSLFDTIDQRAAKTKARQAKDKAKESASWQKANRRAARDTADNRRAEANLAARRAQTSERKEAIEKRKRDAQKRLDEGTTGNPWLQFRDRMYASGNFDMKDISDRWKKQKQRMAREERDAQDRADDLAFAQQEAEEDQAQRRQETAPLREAARRSGRIAKQTGDGYDMHGSGHGDMHGSGYDMHGSGRRRGAARRARSRVTCTGPGTPAQRSSRARESWTGSKSTRLPRTSFWVGWGLWRR